MQEQSGSSQQRASKKPQVIAYTDGASKGNPGPGGCGSVLLYPQAEGQIFSKCIQEAYEHTTNNRMELLAVIRALEALKVPAHLTVYTDSLFIVDAHNKGWIASWTEHNWRNAQKKPVKNRDLWERIVELEQLHDVHFIWVKGHNGNRYNEIADHLASSAANYVIARLHASADPHAASEEAGCPELLIKKDVGFKEE